MDVEVKRHRRRVRLVAILGILPGAWFLLSTNTELGEKLQIGCGYWVFMLIILTAIWVLYAVFAKLIMKDIAAARDHAHSINEQRYYKMAYASTAIEALISSVIFLLSLIGFLATDVRCFLEMWQM